MAVRIEEPNLWNTERLMIQILGPLVKDDSRVAFHCDPGDGPRIMQCVRVMISRKRRQLEFKGKKIRRFTLKSTYHPETVNGVRRECVVVWKIVNEMQIATEMLEDVLTHG